MKTFSYLFFLICSIQVSIGQTSLEKVYGKIVSDPVFFINKDTATVNNYKKVMNYVKSLGKIENEMDKLSLKISFNLNGNNTEDVKSYIFTTQAAITKDFYPYNLDLEASISSQFYNGVLQENISNYHIGLDFFLKRDKESIRNIPNKDYNTLKSDLTYEGYVYADRYANQYLAIAQRYEIGGGIIFNFFSATQTEEKITKSGALLDHDYDDDYFKGLTLKGTDELKKLYNASKIKLEKDKIVFCDKECSSLPKFKGQTTTDGSVLKKAHRKVSNALKKKYSKFRLALLTGIFYEIEKGNANDSVVVADIMQYKTEEIATTNFLRWQLRPTFEYKTDKFSFKLKSYFKMPMPWNWHSVVIKEDEESKKFDYLIDGQASLAYVIDKKFSIGLNVRHIYDNAPKRVYSTSIEGNPLISASNNHTFFNFGLTYKI